MSVGNLSVVVEAIVEASVICSDASMCVNACFTHMHV